MKDDDFRLLILTEKVSTLLALEMRAPFSALVLQAGLTLGLSPRDTFYPAELNKTSYISDASIGTYGGIYKASTNGPSQGKPYGTYDYCSMPHPRTKEYKEPGPIADGSVKGKLIYLEYLQRHQRRSPYNILPGGEVGPLAMALGFNESANSYCRTSRTTVTT